MGLKPPPHTHTIDKLRFPCLCYGVLNVIALHFTNYLCNVRKLPMYVVEQINTYKLKILRFTKSEKESYHLNKIRGRGDKNTLGTPTFFPIEGWVFRPYHSLKIWHLIINKVKITIFLLDRSKYPSKCLTMNRTWAQDACKSKFANITFM